MAIFDIIGPVMIGPSSSHTAGANRIGYMAALCYGRPFQSVEIKLYNSFASTGIGHGTDRAIVAGLLGLKMDDERIPNAFQIAKEKQLSYYFRKSFKRDHHPNEVRIVFHRGTKDSFLVRGISIGAGKAKITQVQDDHVEFGGEHAVLIMNYRDCYWNDWFHWWCTGQTSCKCGLYAEFSQCIRRQCNGYAKIG